MREREALMRQSCMRIVQTNITVRPKGAARCHTQSRTSDSRTTIRVAAQITPFGRATGCHAGDRVGAHIGGYARGPYGESATFSGR
jgi:hypothetical protein